jgi:hypothetical protein
MSALPPKADISAPVLQGRAMPVLNVSTSRLWIAPFTLALSVLCSAQLVGDRNIDGLKRRQIERRAEH